MDPRLQSYIDTRDRRIAKSRGYDLSPMARNFKELLEFGRVRVGGRATSGPVTDPTWVEFGLWNEIVRKARKLGYVIEETDIKHDNAWATKCGGFWNEREYKLIAQADER
jgi:hypothetical protein